MRALDHADDCAGQIERAGMIYIRHLSRLAAKQRTASRSAGHSTAPNHLGHLLRVEL
jgi:hypothetical protein